MSEYVPVALRRELQALAKGQCEYCLLPQVIAQSPHENDHIIPTQHRGKTVLGNLALACFACNRYKGTNIASYDEVTGDLTPLFNPRSDDWNDHFVFLDGLIRPKTAIGRVTAHILAFNREEQITKRQQAHKLGIITLP